jgi:hypothetical protein
MQAETDFRFVSFLYVPLRLFTRTVAERTRNKNPQQYFVTRQDPLPFPLYHVDIGFDSGVI